MKRISLAAARRIALGAQGFTDKRPTGTVTARHFQRALDRMTILQLDSVNVVSLTHYLPMLARLGPYEHERLDKFLYRSGKNFEYMSHEVLVMYVGKIMERAGRDALYEAPRHPYTKALLSAIPSAEPGEVERERMLIEGEIPSPISPPSGCRFRTRCPWAVDACSETDPPLEPVGEDGAVACIRADEVAKG